MGQYVLRRCLLLLPTAFGLVVITFLLVRVIPGDTVTALMADSGQFDEAQIQSLREEWGTDEPIPVQFGKYLRATLTGDLGTSFYYNTPVSEELGRRLFPTAEIALIAMTLALAIAIPFGVLSASRSGGPTDAAVRVLAVLGQALPGFWLGTLVIVGLGAYLHWLPPKGFVYPWDNPLTNIQQVILPALILAWSLSAVLMRLTRNTMIEVLRSDYVRTAAAKGLSSHTVLYRHALRNTLIPVLTVAGVQLGFLLGGSVIVESIFSVPGVGTLLLRAIEVRDYNVIQGVVLVFGLTVMLINLVVDLTYRLIDPRVGY